MGGCWSSGDFVRYEKTQSGSPLKWSYLQPVGNSSVPFTGVIDGQGKFLKNVVMKKPESDYVGLLGCLDSGAQIENLGVENMLVTGRNYVGGLVGLNLAGTITSCRTTGDIKGTESIGGVVGYNYLGEVADCYSAGNPYGTADVGGICGTNEGLLSNCSTVSTISGNNYLGGICGKNIKGAISDCYSGGSVMSQYDSSTALGGICGSNDSGAINDCHSSALVSGGYHSVSLAGVCGENKGIISNSYATGDVTGRNNSGGLCGYNSGDITYCYSRGNIYGKYNSGGLCGYNSGNITYCYSNNNISDCFDECGGLCGYNDGNLAHCYASGTITGSSSLGGLCGKNSNGYVTDCYAIGAVTGSFLVGGLCGYNSYGTISRCYSACGVTGGNYTGGLCGFQYGNTSVIENSFWNTETAGVAAGYNLYSDEPGDIINVSGKITTEMKTQSTFTNVGWDFISTWDIIQNETYPFLRFLETPPPQDPPLPNIPDISSVINPAPHENKLIVLIHGWNRPYKAWWWDKPKPELSELWVSEMADELNAMKNNGQLDPNWKVVVWDWIDESYDGLKPVISNAFEQGKLLADDIIKARSDWQHVHLIAHSAGFMVNYAASEMLLHARRDGKFSGDIHLTTLDAAVLEDLVYDYGSRLDFSRDWADNYYTYGIGDFSGGLTAARLSYAHNEDLASVDGGLNDHGFPHRWYHATITGYYPDGDSDPSNDKELGNDNLFNGIYYGFPRGLEAGNWQESLTISVGNSPPTLIDKMKSVVKAIGSFAGSMIAKSGTGSVITSATTLSLTTGSPVWTHTLLEMPEKSNYISFNYQFQSENKGYLTVYFNENLILIGDQRFDSNDVIESGKIYVGDFLQENNWLTFRLDSITGGQSEISISNVEIGTITNQADINSDLIVNFEDFASFAGQWLKTDCNDQNGWCDECDLDQNGSVDVNDVEYIAANWLWKPVERIKPDLNLTGRVDLVDFSIFASQWMNDCQSPEWCYGSDFDKNGQVDILDLAVFAENWLVSTETQVEPPITKDLIAYWKMDEGGGTIVADSSRNEHDGTLYGATWVNGMSGSALGFDGINDYVNIPYTSDFAYTIGQDCLTISAWVYPANKDASDSGAIYSDRAIDNDVVAVDLNISSGKFKVGGWSPVAPGYIIETSVPVNNQWYLMTAVFDATQAKLYINGNLESSIPLAGVSLTNGGTGMMLGKHQGGYWSNCFNGTIDDVRIYNRVLSSTEIATLYGIR